MTELLPAEPDKNGFYWITIDPSDPFGDSLWRWDAELRWWMDEDVRHWPAEAYADGWRLAWPDPLPTVDQLKTLRQLVIGMREEADARRKIGDHYSVGAAVGFMWAERTICQILGWKVDDA